MTDEKRKLPFGCIVTDREPVKVANPLSGATCMLEPDAVAVYDTIIGAEAIGALYLSDMGKDWFREHFPNEYMVLLD